jgi:hypothetical protein
MDATALEENSPRFPTAIGRQLEDLLRVVTVLAVPAVVAVLLVMVMPVEEVVAEGAPHTGLEEELVAEAIAEAVATQTAMSPVPHAAAKMPAAELKKYDAISPQTAGDNDGFLAFSSRLHNLLLPKKFKPLGITKYNAKQDPV